MIDVRIVCTNQNYQRINNAIDMSMTKCIVSICTDEGTKKITDAKYYPEYNGKLLCEEHYKEGYVYLIEADHMNGAYHTTGSNMFLRADVVPQLFNIEITTDWAFVESGVLDQLEEIINGNS